MTPNHQELIHYKLVDNSDCPSGKRVSISRRALNGAFKFENLCFELPRGPSDISSITLALSDNRDFGEYVTTREYHELRNSVHYQRVCGYARRGTHIDGFFWKDVLYGSTAEHVESNQAKQCKYSVILKVDDFRNGVGLRPTGGGDVSSSSATPSIPGPKICLWLPPDTLVRSTLLGDEQFLVHALNDRIVVYCFDRNVNMSYGPVESTRLRP